MAKTKVITSKQFNLNSRDFIKGLIIAVGTSALYYVQDLIPAWDIDPTLKLAISGLIPYLIKNFFEKDRVIAVVGKEENIKETENTIKRVL